MRFVAPLLVATSLFWGVVSLVGLALAPPSISAVPARPAATRSVGAIGGRVVDPREGWAAALRLPEVWPLREEPAAVRWQADPGDPPRTVVCPVDWLCTLTTSGVDDTILVVGDDGRYRVREGTFRLVAGYPSGAMVHEWPPCRVLQQEQARLSQAVRPANFTCP